MSNCHTRSLIFELPYNFFVCFIRIGIIFRIVAIVKFVLIIPKILINILSFNFICQRVCVSKKIVLRYQKNYTFWIRRPPRKQRHVWVKTTTASGTLLTKKKSFDLIWVDQICSINKLWYFRTPQISQAAKRWTLKYHSRFLSQIPPKPCYFL